jgi:hypothetical protein
MSRVHGPVVTRALGFAAAAVAGVTLWRRSPWSRAGLRRRLRDGRFWAAYARPEPMPFTALGPLAEEMVATARAQGYLVGEVREGPTWKAFLVRRP